MCLNTRLNATKILYRVSHDAMRYAKPIVVGMPNSLSPYTATAAFAVKALTGNVSLETMAGLIQLGGVAAVAPAVLGSQLVQSLTDLVNLLTSAVALVQSPTPAGPVPTPMDPALNAQLQAWVAGLPTAPFLSQKVVVA